MIDLIKHAGWTFRQYGVTLLLVMAVGAGVQSFAQEPSVSQNSSVFNKDDSPLSKRALVMSGHLFKPSAVNAKPSVNIIRITAEASSVQGTQTLSLHLPADADRGSLKVTLNGNDVSDRFHGAGCGDGTACASGTLSAKDGISPKKNVLTAVVKDSSGSMASGRWRSMTGVVKENPVAGAQRKLSAVAMVAGTRAVAAVTPVCDPVNMCPAWLPPTVRFDTLQVGGVQPGNPGNWVQINGQTYGFDANQLPGSRYTAMFMNDQTLESMGTGAYSSGAALANSIRTVPSGTLVIVQTTAGNVVSGDLDASAFGGTNFTTVPSGSLPPGYMAIGVVGQAPGTAYENKQGVSYATGSLVEDAKGNYAFQSSDIVEYAIQPQDASDYGNPTITFTVPANLQQADETSIVFEANATAGQNGLWVLVLPRTNPFPAYNAAPGCHDNNFPIYNPRLMTGCGTFYSVGDGSPQARDQQWKNLAATLTAITPNQLVLVQSIGSVGSSGITAMVQAGTAMGGFRQFAAAFQSLGGTSMIIAGPTFTNKDTYGFVGFGRSGAAQPGGLNALSGGAVEVSTALIGQSGVLHGTLQRDASGLYRPSQVSAEQQAMFTDKGGLNDSDFQLSVVNYQQPVGWPSNSATVLLSGATSLANQQAAYRFISHWLLAGYYVKGIQGPHQDDIHFFFSGSLNTLIDYHTFDPANLPFPSTGSWDTFGCNPSADGCLFAASGDTGLSAFTLADFNAVKMQLSQEVIYLSNTLLYLTTGSTNLKDIVASGNANVGLALNAAASTVLGSSMAGLNAAQIQPKPVVFSWQQIVSLIAGIAQTAADAEGVGEIFTPAYDALSAVAKLNLKTTFSTINTVGAALSTVAAGASITTKNAKLPAAQPFAPYTTTVGELATSDLQSPLVLAFDLMTDSVTSDWERLSNIGPRVVNTIDTTFFAPNQLAQYAALNAITSSSTRTFYASLLPQVFNLHFWTAVATSASPSGAFLPSVGSAVTPLNAPMTCNAFYVTPNSNFDGKALGTLATTQGLAWPTAGGTQFPFFNDVGYTDYWIIDGVVAAPRTANTLISVLDASLAGNLFAANQLAVPMAQMFAANGPMLAVVKDASQDNISGWSPGDVCDATAAHNSSGGVLGGPRGATVVTTTALISHLSGVLGKDSLFTASVTAGKTPVTSGAVYFRIDGSVVGNAAPLGVGGTASSTVAGLALGKHSVGADYSPGDGYGVSSAPTTTFTVYSESPDLKVSMSSANLNVSYSSASTPLALQISSVAGMSGNVTLSCSGLPIGMACDFGTTPLNLAADGNVTASLQIRPTTTATAARAVLALLMLPLIGMGWRRKGSSQLSQAMLAVFAVGIIVTTLTGCSGGGSTTPTTTRETGTKTVLVNAQVGTVSRSVAISLNIQ